MKQIVTYLALLVFCLVLGSCKSSQQISKQKNPVSISDFRSLGKSIEGDWKTVKLSEVVDVRIETSSRSSNPWIQDVPYSKSLRTGFLRWITTVEDKIHFLADGVGNESFCTVRYFNPSGMRWDLMMQCQMWLYTLNSAGEISKRRIKKDEIIYERVNDSICEMKLDIQGNVAGKVLVRQYTLLSPYYTIAASRSAPIVAEPDLQKIEPWIFQKDIPLVYGKYEIRLPEEGGVGGDNDFNFIKSKVIKLGNGEISIQSKKEEVTSRMTTTTYRATKVTATVSNVLPLPKGSNEQPLGIQIIREWDDKLLEETGN